MTKRTASIDPRKWVRFPHSFIFPEGWEAENGVSVCLPPFFVRQILSLQHWLWWSVYLSSNGDVATVTDEQRDAVQQVLASLLLAEDSCNVPPITDDPITVIERYYKETEMISNCCCCPTCEMGGIDSDMLLEQGEEGVLPTEESQEPQVDWDEGTADERCLVVFAAVDIWRKYVRSISSLAMIGASAAVMRTRLRTDPNGIKLNAALPTPLLAVLVTALVNIIGSIAENNIDFVNDEDKMCLIREQLVGVDTPSEARSTFIQAVRDLSANLPLWNKLSLQSFAQTVSWTVVHGSLFKAQAGLLYPGITANNCSCAATVPSVGVIDFPLIANLKFVPAESLEYISGAGDDGVQITKIDNGEFIVTHSADFLSMRLLPTPLAPYNLALPHKALMIRAIGDAPWKTSQWLAGGSNAFPQGNDMSLNHMWGVRQGASPTFDQICDDIGEIAPFADGAPGNGCLEGWWANWPTGGTNDHVIFERNPASPRPSGQFTLRVWYIINEALIPA